MPLSIAAQFTPYSAEYLSLLARKGRLAAKKFDGVWHTTRAVLEDYLRQQAERAELLNKNPDAYRPFISDNSPRLAPSRTYAEDFARVHGAAPVAKVVRAEDIYAPIPVVSAPIPTPTPIVAPATVAAPVAETPAPVAAVLPQAAPVIEPITTAVPSVSAPVAVAAEQTKPVAAPIVEANTTPKTDANFEEFMYKFNRYVDERVDEDHGVFFKTGRFVRRSYRTVFSSPKLFTVFAVSLIIMVILPFRFVSGFAEKFWVGAIEAVKDAQTVMGFRPGTHANEILLLGPNGEISIFGSVETDGQFRSFVEDGIAPITVNSTTKVDNLNADYLDGLHAEEFTLAFVTQNGNVTYEPVFLEGKVEVGSTLLVRGATNLLSHLQVGGDLSVIGDASFSKSLSVSGPAIFKSLISAPEGVFEKLTVKKESQFGGRATFEDDVNIAGSVTARSGRITGSFRVEDSFYAMRNVSLGSDGHTVRVTSEEWSVDNDGNSIFNSVTASVGSFNSLNSTNLSTTNLSISGALSDATGSAGDEGFILQSTGSSTRWVATSTLGLVGGGGGGNIDSLNGLTDADQFFATSTSGGLDLNITSVGDTHTFAISPLPGYTIPLTASTTEWSVTNDLVAAGSASWDAAYASTTALTPSYIRNLFTGTSPITFSSSTGAIGFDYATNNTWTGTNTFDNALTFSALGGGILQTDNSGVVSTTTLTSLTTNLLSSADNIITSNVNGIIATTTLINSLSIATTTNSFQLSVNDVSSEAINLINSNTLNIAAGVLTSTINGVSATTALTTDTVDEGTNNLYFTTARARQSISSASPEISYDNSTGVLTLNPSYNIPLTASTTNWNNFYNTPSSRILAGTGLSWTDNTLNSVWTQSGDDIYTNTSGNVGIGTSTPNFKLDVIQPTNTYGIRTSDLTTEVVMGISTGGTGLVGTRSNQALQLIQNATVRMTIDTNGNVGIGDATPASLFTVGGGDAFQINGSGIVTAGTWNASPIDISSYTNLEAGNGITLTDDTLSVGAAGGLSQTVGGLTTIGILADLNTLGQVSQANQFIVSTGLGTFEYQSTSTARTSLGLGTMAVQNANNVLITGGNATFSNATTSELTVSGDINTQLIDGCVEVAGGVLTSLGVNCGTSTGGLTSLNGQTNSSQSFATSTSGGLNLNITSTGGVHTFNLSPSAGYSIPLTASTTQWSTAFGWGNHALAGYLTTISTSTVRNMFSSSATGLSYNNSTGDFSLTAGYNIPLTASTTQWSTAFGWGNHSAAGYLVAANNLSDLVSSSTARTNLGLGTMAVQNANNVLITGGNATLSSATTTTLYASGNIRTAMLDGCVEIAGGVLTSLGSSCGTASSTISSLNGQTNSSQSFATSTSNGVTLAITSAGGVHTFTPGVASGYTLPLTASSTNWNNFYNTPSTRITAGTGLSWAANTLSLNINSLTTETTFTSGDFLAFYDASAGAIRKVNFDNLPGATGLSSLNGQTNSSQTFATSTSGGLNLNITSTGGVHTFNLSPAAGYNVPLSASTTNWNNFYNTPSTRITAGNGLSWSGNTLNSVWTQVGDDIYRNTTGNVGIGTTNPGTLFHVESTVSSVAPEEVARFTNLNSSSRGLSIMAPTSSSGDQWLGLQAYGTTQRFSIANNLGDENLTVLHSGNVGIGTTTPTYKLAVQQSTGSYGIVTNDGAVSVGIGVTSNTGTPGIIGTLTNHGLQLRTNNSARVHIDTSGNVGIGTTTPGAKLDVVDTFKVTRSNAASLAKFERIGAGASNLQIAGNSGNSQLASSGGVWFNVNNTNDLGAVPNGTNAMAITSAGNVGIGTTTPAALLSVAGGMRLTGAFNDAANSAGTTGMILSSTGSGTAWVATSTLAGSFFQQGGNSFGTLATLGTNDSNNLALETNNVTRMTINTAGNIGIATTTPNYRLDIIQPTNTYGIRTSDLTTEMVMGIATDGAGLVGTRTNQALQLIQNATVRMTIATTGNVGIGDATPASLLTVGAGDAFQVNSSGVVVAGTWNASPIDISSYTNLEAGNGITLTNDTLSVEAAGGLAQTIGGLTTTGILEDLNTLGPAGSANQFIVSTGIGTFAYQSTSTIAASLQAFVQGGNSFGTLATLGTNDANNLAIETNNATRMTILSTGNVGIGDTTPAALFTVGNGDLFQVVSTGQARSIDGTAALPSFSFTGDTNTGMYSDAADNLQFSTGGTLRGTFNSTHLLLQNALTVGPAAVAQVAISTGDIVAGDASGGFHFDASANDLYALQSGATATGVHFNMKKSRGTAASPTAVTSGDDILLLRGWAADSTNAFTEAVRIHFDTEGTISGAGVVPGLLRFYTASSAGTLTQRMFINSDGNIGMGGANAPVSLLQLTTTALNTDGQTLTFFNTDTTQSANQGYGRISFYGSDSTTNASGERAYIYGVADSVGTSGQTDLAFGTAGAGATLAERMRISSAGNVGIGTASPLTNLHMFSSASTTLRVEGGGALGNGGAILNLDAHDNNSVSKITFSRAGLVDTSTIFAQMNDGSAQANSLQFTTGGESTTRMIIGGTGNVGIGTTSPGTKLHVYATGSGDGITADGTTNPSLRLHSNGVTKGLISAVTATNGVIFGSAVDDITFRTQGGNMLFSTNSGASAAMNITSAGNVGIGTTSPSNLLHLSGSATIPLKVESSSSFGSAISLSPTATGGREYILYSTANSSSYGGGKFVIYDPAAGNAARLTIDSSGYVGIGTTTPGTQFVVVGGVNVGDGTTTIRTVAAGGVGLFGTATNHPLGFRINNTERMRIDTAGNVGIGTTAPASLLSVGASNQFQVNSSGAIAAATGITSSGTITFSGLTANRLVTTTTGGALTNTITAANLAASVSDITGVTGTGNLVLSASPTFTGTVNAADASLSGSLSLGASSLITWGGSSNYSLYNSPAYTFGEAALPSSFTDRSRSLSFVHPDDQPSYSTYGTYDTIKLWTNNAAWQYRYQYNSVTNDTPIYYRSANFNSAGWNDWQAIASQAWTTSQLTSSVSGTTNYVAKFTGANTIGNSNIFDNGTNVGIGTTSPGTKLHVYTTGSGDGITADGTTNPSLRLHSNGVTKGLISAVTATNGVIFGSAADDITFRTQGGNMLFSTNSGVSAAMNITSAGNVGIGTTNPYQKLDVSGTITGGDAASTNGSLILAGQYVGATGDYVNTFGGHYSTAGTVIGYAVRPKSGSAGYVSSADNVSWARGAINLDSTGFHVLLGATQAVATGSDVSMTERFTVTTTGNVGIGTASPTELLQIQGASGLDGATPVTLNLRTTNNGTWTVGSEATRIDFASADSSPTASSTRARIAAVIESTTGGSTGLAFYTSAPGLAERMRIDRNGNVGIGNTAPSQTLHVTGNTRITGALFDSSNASGTAGMILSSTGTGTAWTSASAALDGEYFKQGGNSFGTVATLGTNDANALTFETNNSTRMTILSGGNVGIGTASPQSTLHVDGLVELSRLGTAGTYLSSQVQQIWSIGRAYSIDTVANDFGSSYGITYAHTNSGTDTNKKAIAGWGHQILFTSAGVRNAAISLTTGNAYFAGSVGIGMTTPNNPLDVYQNTSSSYSGVRTHNASVAANSGSQMTLQTAGSGEHGFVRYTSPSGTQTIGNAYDLIIGNSWNNDAGNIRFVTKTSGTPVAAMLITGAGNVGIGAAAPSARLHVLSTTEQLRLGYDTSNYWTDVVGSDGTRTLTGFGSNADLNIVFTGATDGDFSINGDDLFVDTSTGGRVGAGTASPASILHVYEDTATTGASAGLTVENDGTGDALIQYLLTGTQRWVGGIDNSDGDKFKISRGSDLGTTNSLTLDTGGNVGIGTMAPGANLEVQGGATAGGILRLSSSDTSILDDESIGGIEFYSNDATVGASGVKASIFAVADDGNFGRSYELVFGTSLTTGTSTERMRIDKSGNVGIGTSSPSNLLHVEGSGATPLTLYRNVASSNVGVEFRNNTASWFAGQSTNGTFAVHTSAALNAASFNIATSGNVGIGTAAPAAKLHVFDATNITPDAAGTGQFMVTGNGYVGFTALDATAMYVGHNSGARRLDFMTDETTRLSILGTGNVGIGTTSPGELLEVNGDARIVGTGSTIGGTTIANASLLVGSASNGVGIDNNEIYSAGSVLHIGTTGAHDLVLRPNNTTVMTLLSTGNVGIGDTTPAALFTVGNGDLFQVNSSGAIAAATGITSSGTITFSGLTANRLVTTTTGGALTNTITAANLAASVSDITGVTGTGNLVLSNAPTFTGNTTLAGTILDDLTYRRFTSSTSGTSHFRKYYDIIHYANSVSTVSGDLRIEIPITTSTMWSMDVVIVEYDGTNTTATKTTNMTITGYTTTNVNRSVITNNPDRISQVRWGRNLAGDRTVILITPSSTFRYPKAYIKEINTSHTSESTFGNSANYAMTITTDETDFALSGTITNEGFLRDSSLVNTFGTQSIGGTKTFTGNVNFPGSGIWNTSGNVGIGTTSPSAQLDIVPSGSQPTLELGRIGGQSSIKSSDGYLMMDSNGNAAALNWYVSDNVILANGGGNVGIGDNSPAALLTVGSGDLFQVVSTGHARSINGTAALPTFSFTGDTNTGMYSDAADTLRFSTGGTLRGTLNSTGLTVVGSIDASTQFLGQASDSAAAPSFSWTGDTDNGMFRPTTNTVGFSTAGTERMRVTATGDVGIGTTSPGRKLHVSDAGSLFIAVERTGPTTAALLLGAVAGETAIYSRASNSSTSAVPLTFLMGNTERMRITATGQVGIGTSSPARELHVEGSVRIDGVDGLEARRGMHGGYGLSTPSSSNWGVNIWSLGPSWQGTGYGDTFTLGGSQYGLSWIREGHSSSSTIAGEGLHIYRAGTLSAAIGRLGAHFTSQMVVDGNVGIGQSSPNAKLEVRLNGASTPTIAGNTALILRNNNSAGDGTNISLLTGSTGTGSVFFGDFGDQDMGYISYVQGTEQMQFGVNAAQRMVINSSGSVGIGTSSPVRKLQVDDSNFDVMRLTRTGSLTNWPAMELANDGGVLGKIGGSADHIRFYDASNTALVSIATATGNVGIGDTTPASLFTVGADDAFQVNSTGIIVAAKGITSTGTITFSGLTANRLVTTTTGGTLTNTITAANLAASVSDISGVTGTGNLVLSANPTFTGTVNAASLTMSGQLLGGLGAMTTAGTLDWDHVSNSQSGSGYTLLRGSTAANAPSSSGNYFHPLNFEYSSKTGAGNITQLAIPYSPTASINEGIFMRGRTSGTWSSWVRIISENINGNVGMGGTTEPVSLLQLTTTAMNTNGQTLTFYNTDTTQSANQGYGRISFYGSDATASSSGERAYIYAVADSVGTSGQTDLTFGTAGAGATLTERMRITSAGRVGIGVANPNEALEVQGTSVTTLVAQMNGNVLVAGCVAANGSTLGTCLSDERLKKNIEPIDMIGLAELILLEPILYEYNGMGGTRDDGIVRAGLLAQQVEEVAPQLISKTYAKLHPDDLHDTEFLQVKYGNLTYGIINALKEFYAEFIVVRDQVLAFADRMVSKEIIAENLLCIGDTCITEADLKTILQKANASGSAYALEPEPPTGGGGDPTPPTEPVEEEGETEVEETEEETEVPEPEPEPEPTPVVDETPAEPAE